MTLLCVGLAIGCYVLSWSIAGLFFTVLSLMLSSVWSYKFIRDRGIIQQARLESGRRPEVIAPPMTSPGSNRLFVPPPLDRRY